MYTKLQSFFKTYFSLFREKFPDFLCQNEIRYIVDKLCNKNCLRLYEQLITLPEPQQTKLFIKNGVVTIKTSPCISIDIEKIYTFKPWRKGPFKINHHLIDSEWRSDLKWDRLKDHLDLRDKHVCDIGCGNGYHLFRMIEEGACSVIGIEPFELYVFQYLLIQRFARMDNVYLLPGKHVDYPKIMNCFDMLFCMGVLYHQKDPILFLRDCRHFLSENGELILETLILDNEYDDCLVPNGRYAFMRNVYHIPSIARLKSWILSAGFKFVYVLDVSKTTSIEQRSTHFSNNFSLKDQLDPNDESKTIEGYPAPVRAILRIR